MKFYTTALILILLGALGLSSVPQASQPSDLVLKNGNIYTVDEQKPRAEAVAVKGDRIVFVGSNRDVQKYVGKNTRVVDLKGRTVVPGLTDSHQHLSGVGFREMTLNLEGINSL
ncbi:MAG TPA: amidohydrolase family protein, partial [Pyrinomonadaceae bacterium]